jgi:hypothetical protein
LIGSRELLFGHGDIPAVGDFQPFLGPGQMLSRWISGFQTVGLGSTAPAPTGFGLFGGLGVVFLGAVGVLRKVLILGLWPVGAIGMWRFTKPVGSRRAASSPPSPTSSCRSRPTPWPRPGGVVWSRTR